MPVSAAAPALYAAALRRELSERNQRYAAAHGLPHALSYGGQPVVLYEPYARGHGNFLPAAWRAIAAEPAWKRRLGKAHAQARVALPRNERGFWSELDSCNSSDALLMNVFCHPAAFRDGRLAALLGVEAGTRPEFGVRARVPLAGGRFDRTEIDMRLGSLLVEAKLTESGFQSRPRAALDQYRDFAAVFERRALPHDPRPVKPKPGAPGTPERGSFTTYQLLRNVLAAQAMAASFCLLADARRPDLIEAWYATLRCVRPLALRLRCQVLTWQELAAVLPPGLRKFLEEKYGIIPG